MKNSDLDAPMRAPLEPSVVLSALALWAALSPFVSGTNGLVVPASFAASHTLVLFGLSRLTPTTRARGEIGVGVLLPAAAAALLDRHAGLALPPLGTALFFGACMLHVALCLDQAVRRHARLESRATEPVMSVVATKRRALYRALLLFATCSVAVLCVARAVSLRSDAALASSWGDAATGASILVAAVPIVLGAHIALALLASRFRRSPPKPGALSRLVIWGALALAATTLLALR
jgi:hypothetical protein